MASGWRVVSETVKQKWKVSADRAFKPTSNSRNEAMFKECTQFADKLRKFEKDMSSWQKRVDGSFSNLRTMLQSYLPLTYDEGPDGTASATEEPKLIGENTDTEMMAATAQDYVRRVEDEIIRPVEDWLFAYKAAQDAMKDLETVRLDLDSRRRTVDELQGKYDRQQAVSTAPTAPQLSPRQITDMQQAYGKMRHKEEKLQGAQHHYQEMEKQVFEQICALIDATGQIRQLVLAFVCISKDCFTTAYGAVVPGMNNNGAMLPQQMAGLRINTSPKQTGSSPMPSPRIHKAQTPTKKFLNTIGSAASALKGLVSPRKGVGKPYMSPSHTPIGTPRASPFHSPAHTPRSHQGDLYYQESFTKSPYKGGKDTMGSSTPRSSTPRSSDMYGGPAGKDLTNPFGTSHTPRGSTGKYTAKDGFPSPAHSSRITDMYAQSDQGYMSPAHGKEAGDPYSNYQPPAPKWNSPTSTTPQYAF